MGFTKIDNNFIDLALNACEPAVFTVVMYIYRQTAGFNRSSANISLGRMESELKMSKNTVKRAVKSGIESGWIACQKVVRGSRFGHKYSVQIPDYLNHDTGSKSDHVDGQNLTGSKSDRVKNGLCRGSKSDHVDGQNLTPFKRNKENIKEYIYIEPPQENFDHQNLTVDDGDLIADHMDDYFDQLPPPPPVFFEDDVFSTSTFPPPAENISQPSPPREKPLTDDEILNLPKVGLTKQSCTAFIRFDQNIGGWVSEHLQNPTRTKRDMIEIYMVAAALGEVTGKLIQYDENTKWLMGHAAEIWQLSKDHTAENIRLWYGKDGNHSDWHWYRDDWRGQKNQAPTIKTIKATISIRNKYKSTGKGSRKSYQTQPNTNATNITMATGVVTMIE